MKIKLKKIRFEMKFYCSHHQHPLFKDESFKAKEWIKENCSINQPSLIPEIKVEKTLLPPNKILIFSFHQSIFFLKAIFGKQF
jgi:hypothetical protein